MEKRAKSNPGKTGLGGAATAGDTAIATAGRPAVADGNLEERAGAALQGAAASVGRLGGNRRLHAMVYPLISGLACERFFQVEGTRESQFFEVRAAWRAEVGVRKTPADRIVGAPVRSAHWYDTRSQRSANNPVRPRRDTRRGDRSGPHGCERSPHTLVLCLIFLTKVVEAGPMVPGASPSVAI